MYKAGQGRWGTDEGDMAKIIVMSPPKYLSIINAVYADEYGYTLLKALEEEMGDSNYAAEAALFTLGMKLKPYETIAKLIKKTCAGFGTNELLLACSVICYQGLLVPVEEAHKELYEKSIYERVRDETGGNFEKLLVALLSRVIPE